jgi:primosomal protein N' (replication factor Y)
MTASFAEVAVPVPLAHPLVYELPEALAPLALPGVRVRVTVGRRRLVGVLLGLRAEAPAGIALRPVEEVLDAEPLLPPEVLALARFTTDYYLAPIGEVLRAVFPGRLPAWGDRRFRLTDAGALAPPRSAAEAMVVEALRELGRASAADLQRRLGSSDLPATLAALEAAGRVVGASREGQSGRYRNAVALAPGDPAELAQRVGRSPAGREVVEVLAALGRPATVHELVAAVGCGEAVVRRLVGRGVLRQFTEVETLGLDRHRMRARERPPIALRDDQEAALAALVGALDGGAFAGFLLRGVTGAGKTEVYLRAAAAAVERGRTALLMVPEIALVPALAREVAERFRGASAILHSGLGESEREQEWERVRSGEARVVVGPRSAVFAPLPELGLVVVDEEQDAAYKQESVPRYHGRDLALFRGSVADAVVVLVSATPSLESRLNVERGKLRQLELTRRVGQGKLPEGIVVDLRGEVTMPLRGRSVSRRLEEELRAALEAGDQAILLRNRRGYSPLLLCRACGEDLRCDDCGLPRTYHRREAKLLCHYCGSRIAVPERCPTCGEAAMEAVGSGTERVEEELAELFPGVALDVLDRDSVRRRGSVAAILEGFAAGRTRILVGTQMVSKGHHFPNVALTGVLAADAFLGFPDFRAVERTYALLTQLAGRGGRGERPAKVVIQTFHPEHYAIQAALRHDDAGFAAEEMRFRRLFHYPPYTRMVQLLLQSTNRARAEAEIGEIGRRLRAHPEAAAVRVLGPAPAPFERLRGKWRFQLLVRGASGKAVRSLVAAALPESPAGELVVDVDPYSLL